MTEPVPTPDAPSSETTQQSTRRWFPALDGLRCLAALGVSLAHVGTAYTPGKTLLAYGGSIIEPGLVLFFMISGFLVYRPFVHRNVRASLRRLGPDEPHESSSGPRVSGWVYLMRRILRIMPLYWTVLTVRMVVNPDSHPTNIVEYIQVYLLLPFPNPGVLVEKGLGLPTWTLAIELPFYVLLPAYAAGVRWITSKLDRSASVWAIESATIGVMATLVLMLAVAVNSFAGAGLTLLLGMAFAVLATHEEVRDAVNRTVATLAHMWGACLAVVLLLWFVGAQIALNSDDAFGTYETGHWALWMTMAAAMFLPAAFGPDWSGYNRFLASRVMRWLAPLTYGFYLWHPVVLYFTKQWIGPELGPLVYTTVILSLLCALATYYAVELPMASVRRWMDARFTPSVPVTEPISELAFAAEDDAAEGGSDDTPLSPPLSPSPEPA